MALFLAYWGRRTKKGTAKKANVFVSLGMTLALIAKEKKTTVVVICLRKRWQS